MQSRVLSSSTCGKRLIANGNDDGFILRAVEMYKDVLDAREIKLENRGHFSFLIKELPELLQEIVG